MPQAQPPGPPANSGPTPTSALRQALEVLFGELGELGGERAQLTDALLSLGFLGDDPPADTSTCEKLATTQYPLLAAIAEAANQVRIEKLALRTLRNRLPL